MAMPRPPDLMNKVPFPADSTTRLAHIANFLLFLRGLSPVSLPALSTSVCLRYQGFLPRPVRQRRLAPVQVRIWQ